MGNLADLVRRAAESAPGKTALVAEGRSLTWADLDAAVDRLATGLIEQGLTAGDRVGVLLPNGMNFVTAYFAILRAGLVAMPLNISYTVPEIAHQVEDAAARLVITEAGLAERAGPAPVLVVGSPDWETASTAVAWAGAAGARDGDLAVLLYTSGTTGRPKGAMLTHAALLANLDQLARIRPPVVANDDVVLLVLPLFHVYGLNAGLGMMVHAGATGVLADRFDPVDTLALIREHKVTNIVGAPPMYVAWSLLPDLRDAFASVRLAVSGAAPLPADVMTRFADVAGVQVHEGYGLTETAPVLTTTLCSPSAKPDSIGRPIPGIELRLVDETGDDADEDDPGEIVVRGANVFAGYWPDGSGGADSTGWFRTGDVAYADTDGDLFLVDRVRELILVSGFNVYPREVEDVIASHPDVAEVAVIGVPHPYTGETVRALVVPREGSTLDADSVIDFAATRLARFKCPTSVEIVSELPHSTTGKVAKGRLRSA